jgi:signal transduction histidine kinase
MLEKNIFVPEYNTLSLIRTISEGVDILER